MIRSICSILPALLSERGHEFVYQTSLRLAAEKIGLSHQAFLPVNSEILNSEIPNTWQKNLTPYIDNSKGNRLVALIKKVVNLPRLTFSVVKAMKKKPQEQEEVLFFDCISPVLFFWVTLSFLFVPRSQKSFWVMHRYPPTVLKSKGTLIKITHTILRRMFKNRFVIFTDTESLQKSLSDYFHQDVSILPVPHVHFESKENIVSKFQGLPRSYVLWWPGEPREAKGKKILEKLLKVESEFNSKFKLVASKDSGFEALPKGLQVELVNSVLSREEYINWLNACDFVILPYDREVYKSSTSGIFIEAICAKKIPLVTSETWMAEELKKYGLEELIIDWQNPNLFESLELLMQNDAVLEKLLKMKDAYQNIYGIESMSVVMQQHVEALAA